MTDIEKQIAQAAETRKSTAILSDPEHVTEPLQILTFVNSFFHAYSSKTEVAYKKAYNNDMLNFGKMLINFVDPPALGTIINNGDYFIYYEQSKFKMDTWFEIFSKLNQRTNDPNKSYFTIFKEFLEGEKKELPKNAEQSTFLQVTIITMFEILQKKYIEFQYALMEAEKIAIQNLTGPSTKPDYVEGDKALADSTWIKKMDAFLNIQKETDADAISFDSILQNVKNFINNVVEKNILLSAAPFPIGTPLPIGQKVGSVTRNMRPVTIRTLGNTASSSNTSSSRSAPPPILTPESDKANADRVNKETNELTNNSVIEHYKQMLQDFGGQMLELFRSFNFPPIFTLDKTPSFTAEWEGYIRLAYNSFNALAKQRHAYLAKIGSGGRGPVPRWSREQIYADEEAAAIFAEFVGYKKSIPQNTIAPGPNVQRTNATYHYGVNNMSLRFIALYDYMVEKNAEGDRSRRKTFLTQYGAKK